MYENTLDMQMFISVIHKFKNELTHGPPWNSADESVYRSTTAQDFVGVMSAVPLALPSYYI